jgi:outer membrane protein assembly factor BamB
VRTLGILFVLVLLAGCSSEAEGSGADREPPASAASSASPASVVEGLATSATRMWSTRLDALQDPVAAGDVLVVPVAARGDEIDVVALDREDGEVLWRRPLMVVDASIGAYLGDLVHTSAAGSTYVVMQQAPTGRELRPGLALPYLALDPRTGEVVARTRPVVAQFGSPPCDDGIDACLRFTPDDRFAETRWRLGSWTLRPEKEPLPAGTNALAPDSDVYTVYGPVRNYAVAKAVGRVGPPSWRVPHLRITGSRRWLVDDEVGLVDEEAGVAVVQLLETTDDAVVRRYERGAVVRFDLARRRTAGLDLDTGEVLWRHDGADIRCLELSRYDVPVRCAFTGKRSYQQDRDPRLESPRGWLEGYDPRSGETTWRQELSGRAVRTLVLDINRLDASVDRVLDADDLAVLPTPDGPRLLSLVDGSTREVPADEVLLCSTTIPFRHRCDTDGTGVVGFGDERERRVVKSCSPSGEALGVGSVGRLGADALLTGGVDAGDGVRVFATKHAITAYRLS